HPQVLDAQRLREPDPGFGRVASADATHSGCAEKFQPKLLRGFEANQYTFGPGIEDQPQRLSAIDAHLEGHARRTRRSRVRRKECQSVCLVRSVQSIDVPRSQTLVQLNVTERRFSPFR